MASTEKSVVIHIEEGRNFPCSRIRRLEHVVVVGVGRLRKKTAALSGARPRFDTRLSFPFNGEENIRIEVLSARSERCVGSAILDTSTLPNSKLIATGVRVPPLEGAVVELCVQLEEEGESPVASSPQVKECSPASDLASTRGHNSSPEYSTSPQSGRPIDVILAPFPEPPGRNDLSPSPESPLWPPFPEPCPGDQLTFAGEKYNFM